MVKISLGFIFGLLIGVAGVIFLQKTDYEAKLNTANTIRGAWEFRRLSESLAENVDTRCHIAQLAASQVEDLLQAAEFISENPSPNPDSDSFAIQSTTEAFTIFEQNNVLDIEDICVNGEDS